MSNTYHIPVVITTEDKISRGDAVDYVSRILANLEEADSVHTTYVEDGGLDRGDVELLMKMLSRVDADAIENADAAIDSIASDSEENT